jgi:hypothetical protein
MNAWDISGSCTARQLHAPSEEQLLELGAELGTMPDCWRPEYSSRAVAFRRWLRDKGLHELWRQPPEVQEADAFLLAGSVRKDFEALTLVHGTPEEARTELLLKYGDNLVPSVEALYAFVDAFWNLGSMSLAGLQQFIEMNENRQELSPAVQGEMADTYGFLGLSQRVGDVKLLQNFLDYVNQQVQAARRVPGAHSGQKVSGMGTLLRAAIEAQGRRDRIQELTQEGGDSILDRARKFQLARQRRQRAIPSIDELSREEPIDAEFEEIDNVTEFPKRGS